MSWLTGNQIINEVDQNQISIKPFNKAQVNPNSYDYRLAPLLRQIIPNSISSNIACIDPKNKMKFQEIHIPDSGYLLLPGAAYLGHTVEVFGSDYFASLVTGKSSVGRIFINNHHCAGLIDQGFIGHITLEITCQIPTIIYPNMRLGQIFWFKTFGKPLLYEGKYQNNNAALPSRIYLDIQQ